MSAHRKQLNPNQVQLLKLLYKFRFVNSDLLARYKGTTRISVNHSLAILVDQKFVDRRYDNSYKIQGKSALYYLTPTGLRVLKGFMPLNDNVVHAMYKNSTVTEGFINECLLIMEVCIVLRDSYPDTFNIFSRSELAEFDYFPEPKPSLYLSRKKPSKTKHNGYMLDIITDNRKFIIKKQVQIYINHYDSGVWGEEQYPTILFLCATPRIEENTLKQTESLLEDFDFFASSTKRLLGSDANNKAIWCDALEMDELISL